MTVSKSFGASRPKINHLVPHGKQGGLAGEIADLRDDTEAGFVAVETPGHGGTNLLAVEEFVNPAAADDNAIKTAVASVAAITTYSGTALNGIIGAAVISPPRNMTVTTGAGGTPADAPATATFTGLDVNGAVISETINVSQIAGTAAGAKAFAYVTSIAMPSADGVGATLEFGTGNIIGLGSKVKVRNTVANILAEMLDGAFVSGGGAAAGAATAVNQVATATNQNATAVNDGLAVGGGAHMVAPIAAEAISIVADVLLADGAQIIAAQPDWPRKLQITITDGDASISAGTVTVVGIVWDGTSVNEVQNIAAGVIETDYAYKHVTSITVAALAGHGAGDNISVGVSKELGLPVPLDATLLTVEAVYIDGVKEAPGAVDTTAMSVDTTTAPNAARVFDFVFSYLLTPTQQAHNHVQDAHNHTQNAHSHIGAAGTFAAPATGAPNGTFTPATAPNGAHDYVVVYERDLS